MPQDERRDLTRFVLNVPAYVVTRPKRSTPIERYRTRTRDVSAHGAFIYLEKALSVGTRISLEMQLVIGSLPELLQVSENVTVTVNGKVVRRNHEGIGIMFDAQLRFHQLQVGEEVKTNGTTEF